MKWEQIPNFCQHAAVKCTRHFQVLHASKTLLFLIFSPSSVFLRPSAPTTTSKSKLATGWSAGRIAALHPISKNTVQRENVGISTDVYL